MMDDFSFNKLFSISKDAVLIFFENINVFYLGIISVLITSLTFILHYYNIKIPTTVKKEYITHLTKILISHANEAAIIGLVLFILLLLSIFLNSFSSTALINYILNSQKKESFTEVWNGGKEKWKEYIIYYFVYYIIVIAVSVVFLILFSIILSSIPVLNIFIAFVFLFAFIVVFALSFIGVRLIIDKNTDIIDSIRITYKSFWNNKFGYFRLISFYFLVFIILSLIFVSAIDFLIVNVSLSLISHNLFIGITAEVVGFVIALYISAFLSVFSSVYWTKGYILLRDLKIL